MKGDNYLEKKDKGNIASIEAVEGTEEVLVTFTQPEVAEVTKTEKVNIRNLENLKRRNVDKIQMLKDKTATLEQDNLDLGQLIVDVEETLK